MEAPWGFESPRPHLVRYRPTPESVARPERAGFPPAMHAVVVYRLRDGLIQDVVFLL